MIAVKTLPQDEVSKRNKEKERECNQFIEERGVEDDYKKEIVERRNQEEKKEKRNKEMNKDIIIDLKNWQVKSRGKEFLPWQIQGPHHCSDSC